MPDIGTQLRTYFDETVERVTEQDVRIRATTERGVPLPSPRFRPRPLAAGAIGFGLAMTLLGVVMVADRVFGAGMSEAGSNGGGRVVAPAVEQGSPWLFLPVVFGLGLLATGIISARRHASDRRERGDETMQTVEKVETVEAPVDNEMLTLRRRNRWLAWLAGILAVAVVAMGAWLIFGDSSGQNLTAEQEQMLETVDEAMAAWNAHDGEALAALYSAEIGYHDNGNMRYYVEDGALARYVSGLSALNFSVEPRERYVIGNYVVSGDEIPAGSGDIQLSIHAMSPDGNMIYWHLAP